MPPSGDTGSDDNLFPELDTDGEPDFGGFAVLGEGIAADAGFPGMSTGDIVDAEIVDGEDVSERPAPPAEPRAIGMRTLSRGGSGRGSGGSASGSGPREAKTGPPSVDEWQRFFGKIVLRVLCDFYINRAFASIDESEVSDRDLDRLKLTDEERDSIAIPVAELSNKSKFMRKHGRTIVASGDSINSIIVLGMWMSRVQRIASKYKPKTVVKGNLNGSSGQGSPAQAPNGAMFGAHGGRFPPGFTGNVVSGSG